MPTARVPLEKLRDEIARALATQVKSYNLPEVTAGLGLAPGDASEAHRSKFGYVKGRLLRHDAKALTKLASRIVEEFEAADLEAALDGWQLARERRVSELTRAQVLKRLDALDELFGDEGKRNVKERLSVLDPPWTGSSVYGLRFDDTFENDFSQHYVRNPDWSHAELLEHCGALNCSQVRFFRLLEAIVHPRCRRGADQQKLVDDLNALLKVDGYALTYDGDISGHLTYTVRRLTPGVEGAAKNLIFAPLGVKPRIVLSDSINNDVRIVEHADKCLIYDRPLRSNGLRWVELAQWWMDSRAVADLSAARRGLGERLLTAVQMGGSPGEAVIFQTYYRYFAERLADALPALLPQVYLHYDAMTARQYGGQPLLPRQCMDFLLLLENHVRIVIEVDGKHHFAKGDEASPSRYAQMVAEDRALRLRGYELYRFGAAEFCDVERIGHRWQVGPKSTELVMDFFERLFCRHGLTPAASAHEAQSEI